MSADPKRVKEIFLEAAEQPDEVARVAYLDRACGGDAGLRGRVEALLQSHEPDGSFLGTPAAVIPDPEQGATRAFSPDPERAETRTGGGEAGTSDDESLTFLSPAQRPDSLGRIGHYEVLQVLGRGGFGIVFRAFDDVLQRVVAVKVMAPQLAATSPARKRFLREARTSAQVRHENVVQVYEVAEQPLPYLAMEFIPGETLQQRLDRQGPLDVSEVLRIGRQVAEGLAAAHATDLIHRDIKPSNVMLEGGPRQQVKITDFGLARAADDASISQSGIIAGTPMYMAPEQALGHKLDQRADLFSLGSVLYQMAAGRAPFRANSTVAVLKRVAEDTPRDIREIIPETPQWLCNIIAKLHEKKPEDRYQSAREIADVLADCEQQLKAHGSLKDFSRIPGGNPQRRRIGRKWKRAAAAVVLLLAVAVGAYAGPFALRYVSDEGKVTFTNDYTEDKLLVRRDGQVVATLDSANGSAHLASGEYELEAVCAEGEEVSGVFTGTRNLLLERAPGWGADGPVLKLTIRRGDAIRVGFAVKEKVPPPSLPDGWVRLFNGKDLTGWKETRKGPTGWKVERNVLKAAPGQTLLPSVLSTERTDFRDFHLRMELRTNSSTRASIDMRSDGLVQTAGYGVWLMDVEGKAPIFSLTRQGSTAQKAKPVNVKPEEWYQLEITAYDNVFQVQVDNQLVAKWTDDNPLRTSGPITIFTMVQTGMLEFRKIEIKEFPPSPPSNAAAPPAAVAPFDTAKAKEHQAAWAKHLGVAPEITNRIGMKLCLIPPGEFTMGYTPAQMNRILPDAEEEWERNVIRARPAGRVRLSEPFYIGAHEVTVGQFRRFVEAKKYRTTAERDGKGGEVWDAERKVFVRNPEHVWSRPSFAPDDNHPVVLVSPEDAEAFCAWLSAVDGRQYVVPRDEHWEYACRAGTETLWWTGDSKEVVLRAEQLDTARPRPVGSLSANPFGLFDVHGNVAEIVWKAGGYGWRAGGAESSVRVTHSAFHQPILPNRTFDRSGFRVAIVGDLKPKVAPSPAVSPFDAAKAKEFQEAWAKHLGVEAEVTNSIGMKFRLIPPGEFLIGSPPEDIATSLQEIKRHDKTERFLKFVEFVEARSGPQRAIKLTKPYYLGTCEVTVEEFRRFVKETGYRTLAEQTPDKPYWEKPGWKAPTDPRHPVTYMAWDDAVAFCDWLSKHEGRTYRLPTEAEWEFACRAGTTARWNWGDDPGQFLRHAQFLLPIQGGLGKVGEKLPNAFGLYDMHGNAEEWCADWHLPLLGIAPADPLATEQKDATGRVVRGGFGFDIPELGRSGRRSFTAPNTTTGIALGFRVALVGDLAAKPAPPAAEPAPAPRPRQ